MEDPFDLFKAFSRNELGRVIPQSSSSESSAIEIHPDPEAVQEFLQKRFKKLKHKILYINMEYEEVGENFKIAQTQFISLMKQFCRMKRVIPPFEAGPDPSNVSGAPETPEESKELYREIVKKTHPDLTQGLTETEIEERASLYHEATEGKHSGDFQKILKVALELNINPKNLTASYLDEISSEIEKVEHKISEIKKDLMWNWYYCGPEDQQKIFEKLTEGCKPI